MEKRIRDEFVKAYQWSFGSTKKEALERYKGASPEFIYELIRGFIDNAKKAFYDD